MLHVTSRARTELHDMLLRALDRQPDDAGAVGFRLVAGENDGSQLGLALDAPGPDDEVLEHEGRSVLILDSRTSGLVGDLTLDVVETAEGIRLGLRG